jgi:16S rRNA (cytosine1402-N4)-methyltransferase
MLAMAERTTASGPSEFSHEPVMIDAVVEACRTIPAGVFVDATVGGGGHAAALLDARGDLELHGFDQDPDAVEAARRHLERFGERALVHKARFDRAPEVLGHSGVEAIAGFLMDLGVSSPQFDRPERGFSYRFSGPLDMRMDPTATLTAAVVVNDYSPAELLDVLRSYGDERHARRIVDAVVARRPIETTAELADIVRDAVPAAARRQPGHPAKRSFQAIRIEVNRELAILAESLGALSALLVPGGIGLVLTYHSGEDRIVKDRLRDAVEGDDLHGLPRRSEFEWAWRGAERPSPEEVERNPRATSARLRGLRRRVGPS